MRCPEVDVDIVRSASERGVAHASWLMSVLCRSGDDCEASDALSFEYLKKAVQQGSLAAKRDLALMAVNGHLEFISVKSAWLMIEELIDVGFDRAQLGKKLLLSGSAKLAHRGYETLKLHNLQNIDFEARYLAAVYEATEGKIHPDVQFREKWLRHLRLGQNTESVERALALSGLLTENTQVFSRKDVLERLADVESLEACVDAILLLECDEFKDTAHDLRERVMLQLDSFAAAGHIQARVQQLMCLLSQAVHHHQAALAEQLIALLMKHPQFHMSHADALIHSTKSQNKDLYAQHKALAQRLVDSGVVPVGYRTLGVEQLMAGEEKEAVENLVIAVNLELFSAMHPLARQMFMFYAYSSGSETDARFWAEALLIDAPDRAPELINDILEWKGSTETLSDAEILKRRDCLECLSANDEVEPTRDLAKMLLKGHGPVLPEPARGFELLQKAAQSDGRAMYELAHVYQAGVHVPRDMYLAQYYFDQAAKHGHSNAIYEDIREQRKAKEKAERESATNPINKVIPLAATTAPEDTR